MERKIISGISFGLLFAAFALVSLLVILTKRHPYFVAKKLKLGALIISLSGAAVGCGTTTCYVPVQDNYIEVDQTIGQSDSIVVNRAISDSITGKIYSRHGNAFSFAVYDVADSMVFKENILPLDGAFDEDNEEFKLGFGKAIPAGSYDLRFYETSRDSIQGFQYCRRSYPLTITD